MCLDLSSAFDLEPHALLLRSLTDYGLPAAYINCFRSYLPNRLSRVPYSGALSSPFQILSGVQQGSVLELLLFNAFTIYLCNVNFAIILFLLMKFSGSEFYCFLL
jgi:hypothetical protein